MLGARSAERRTSVADMAAGWPSDTQGPRIPGRRDIVVVYGPAGCGKTSTAKVIAEVFGFTYIEGDEVSLASW